MKGKCRDCKYADEYIPLFAWRFSDPRCSIHHKKISLEDSCNYYTHYSGGVILKLEFNNNVITDLDTGKTYNTSDNTDMMGLCDDVNRELFNISQEMRKSRLKLDEIKKMLRED